MKNKIIEYENLSVSNSWFHKEYIELFKQFLINGKYILGENVKKFEYEFSKYINRKYCIGVGNGLDALILSLKSLDLEKDSEVIVPSNTYIATILAVLHCNLKPVLVEPDINTYNIDPYKIEEKITKKTKVILVVHLYGQSCNMDHIIKLTKKYNLFLIEDCAQSHGAKYNNKFTGSFGILSAFSFYPTKNLGALGDAGAILTDSKNLYEKIIKLRNYGSSKKYFNELIGYNSRLDELQAIFLLKKLEYLEKIILKKRKLASLYLQYLKVDFIKPVIDPDYYNVYHIFNVRHEKRDQLRNYLLKNNIITEIHYPIPPHKQKALVKIFRDQNFPISDLIHKTTLSLPISYGTTETDVLKIIEIMNKF